MNKRGDQVMQMLRQADPASSAPDAAQAAAGYRRLRVAIEDETPTSALPARRRRPRTAALAAACCALVLLAALIGVIARPGRHHEAQPSRQGPRVTFTVTVDGTAYRFDQPVPVVAGRTYAISVRAAIAPRAHFLAFRLIVAGDRSGISAGAPTGNFDPVATIAQPPDSFTATGAWKARPMGGPAWIEAVYSTTDANGSMGTAQTLVLLQVR